MDITPEKATMMMETRFQKYPELGVIATDPHLEETLAQILDFESVDQSLLPVIKNEILVPLALYAPIYELAQNIQESTGLSEEASKNVSNLVETLILKPVYNDLLAYGYLWEQELQKSARIPEANKDFKEKLELRPDGVPAIKPEVVEDVPEPVSDAQPLTREAVLSALSPRRTMANDIASIKQDTEKVHGYEAYVAKRDEAGEK
jgi:hypothetical protein